MAHPYVKDYKFTSQSKLSAVGGKGEFPADKAARVSKVSSLNTDMTKGADMAGSLGSLPNIDVNPYPAAQRAKNEVC